MVENDLFDQRYRRALAAALAGDGTADAEATSLGRDLVAAGGGVLELLALHRAARASCMAAPDGPDQAVLRHERADAFLTAAATPLAAARAALSRDLAANERRLNDFIEARADDVWETDREHRFTYVGPGSAGFGRSPEFFLGRTRWELIGVDPAQHPEWARHKADLDAHRPFRAFRISQTLPTGVTLHSQISGQPIFDAHGVFQGYRGVFSDETEIVEATNRAGRAEARLRDAIESISGGVIICDPQDRIVLWNHYIEDRFPGSRSLLERGIGYEDFNCEMVARGYYPDAVGRADEWVAERMKAHRQASGAMEFRQEGGRWALLRERRMSDGGIALIGVDITPLKETQAKLVASEARLDRAQEIAGIGSWEEDLTTGTLLWSKEMRRMRGSPASALEGERRVLQADFTGEDPKRLAEWFDTLKTGQPCEPLEVRQRLQDGADRIVRFEGQAIRDDTGQVIKIAGTLSDVTQLRSMERQLIHAQKMEAIGTLTGGMAHDFNNLLGVVIGNLDLLRDVAGDKSEIEDLVRDALEAALHGADLTRRLLAFARRQPLQPERLDANELIDNTARLLRRTLGEEIEIALAPAADLWRVVIDPAQLEAALTNLATNARDAMPKGGRITIATRNDRLDEDFARQAEVVPGDYVVITVSDTGTGMTPDIAARVFEPFYTTKQDGKGSGLGLAMVFGFMRQSGGHVSVHSEPGNGTAVRLYLPRGAEQSAAKTAAAPASAPSGGGETVLIVEDNDKLRAVLLRQLEDLGYRVLAADSGAAALAILEQNHAIDLLLTDIVMPGGMNGIELTHLALARRPDLRVLLTSGFPDSSIGGDVLPFGDLRLLSKPYRRDELARRVREALDEAPAPAKSAAMATG